MKTQKKKEAFTDVIELKLVIPEDKLHPLSGDPLPHKVIISHKKNNPQTGERTYFNQVTFSEAHPDRKATFLIRVMLTIVEMIKVNSTKRPLKQAYLKAMETILKRLLKSSEGD